MGDLKQSFILQIETVGTPEVLTVAVLLPSGAIEVITNTKDTLEKASYYNKNYDEYFRLKSNPLVRIVGFMIV